MSWCSSAVDDFALEKSPLKSYIHVGLKFAFDAHLHDCCPNFCAQTRKDDMKSNFPMVFYQINIWSWIIMSDVHKCWRDKKPEKVSEKQVFTGMYGFAFEIKKFKSTTKRQWSQYNLFADCRREFSNNFRNAKFQQTLLLTLSETNLAFPIATSRTHQTVTPLWQDRNLIHAYI